MQKKVVAAVACAALALLALRAQAQAQDARLPVFYLRYSGGVGSEELEEDDSGLEPASLRHSVSLRIKEDLSRTLVTNLTFFYSTKDYTDEPGDYTYFYLKPQVSCDLSDRVTLETEVRSKWVAYDGLDAGGRPKDYLQLTGGIATTYEPVRGTRLTGSVGTGFDLYDNDAKSEQSYALGLRLLSRLDGVTVGGHYRGILYTPLGAASTQARSLTSEFGATLTWDPNK